MTVPVRTLRAGGAARGVPKLAGDYVLMADCSEFQPDITDAAYLDWSQAIAIRALYGAQHVDAAWYGGQRRALLHAGGARFTAIYIYLVAGQTGAAQAQAFYNLVGAIQPGEVFVADFEEGAKPELTNFYNEMLALYGQHLDPWLWTYTGEDFGQSQSVLPVQWIAAYGKAEPSSPHTLWQFTDNFTVPGVGSADCSVYRGSIDQLAALAYPAEAPPWVFSPVRALDVPSIGPHSVRLTWVSPAARAPLAVDHYQVTIRKDGEDLPSYPRTIPKGRNPESHLFGSLPPGTALEALVRAAAAGGAHASDWATVTFTTPKA